MQKSVQYFLGVLKHFFIICSKHMIKQPHGNDSGFSAISDCADTAYKIILDIQDIVYDKSPETCTNH